VNATNPPLEQWQVDHIRKMKQELGMPQSAPYAEEVTMDGEDTETDMPTGGLDYAQSQRDYDLASQKVRDQIQSHIDVLEGARGKLRERRVGPSDSEKWLAIAAALGQPTRTGSFGESLGNLAQTLGAQKSARREAEEKRDLMLEKYGLDVGTERLRLLQTGATQSGQVLRAAAAAQKAGMPKSVVDIGGVASEPLTGAPVVAPSAKAYADLEANPTPENYKSMVDAYPRFAREFKMAYDRGVAKFGGAR
jgi:hypothetical protein